MKRTAMIMSFGFAMSSFAAPSGLKIGLVDLQKALQSVDAGKQAKNQLDKDVTNKKSEIEKTRKKLESEVEAYNKKKAIMSESARTTKEAELQKRFAEWQNSAAESQMELQKRERELTEPLLQELETVVEGMGKEKEFQLILEKNRGGVLYAQGAEDLTDDVVDRFNSKKKKKK